MPERIRKSVDVLLLTSICRVPIVTSFMKALMKLSWNSINFRLFSICENVMESKAVEKSVESNISGLPSIFALTKFDVVV